MEIEPIGVFEKTSRDTLIKSSMLHEPLYLILKTTHDSRTAKTRP